MDSWQGNRSSISASVVEANKWVVRLKGQIGHFVVSIAKTLDQKKKMAPLLWRYLNLVSVRMGLYLKI
jgi:hypothetical protein